MLKILSGTYDDTIKIWDSETGNCLNTLNGHTHCITSVSFNYDGTRIVSGSFDEIRRFD